MKSNADGPTVDEFSTQDTTDSISSEAEPQKKQNKRPRKKKEIIFDWLWRYSSEICIGIVVFLITSFIGSVVFNHSNHLVEHDKEIEFLKDGQSNVKEEIHDVNSKIESVKDKIHEVDKKVEIQDVRINNKKK